MDVTQQPVMDPTLDVVVVDDDSYIVVAIRRSHEYWERIESMSCP